MKELISTMIQEAVEGCSKYMADIIAVVLVANGVTILPEGAIILTKAEVEALGEYNVAKWVYKETEDAFFCSRCDREALIDANTIGVDFAIAELSDYCPHCGAKMESEDTE